MNNADEFDYKKYKQLIIKKKYLFVSLALIIMAGVTITSYALPERYGAKCTIFIEKSVISELVKGIAISPSFEDKLRVLSYTLRSRALLLKVYNDLNLDKDNSQRDKMIGEFQEKTEIRFKDNEGMFTIAFSSENPRLARDYVNALARRYIEENTTSKREESNGASNFLAEQIATVKAKIEETEALANSYKRDTGNVLAQNESGVLAEIDQAQQKMDEIAIKRRHLENMRSLAAKNNPLKARLAVLKKKQQDLGLVYTDNHPELVEINNEIAAVTQQLASGSARVALVDDPSHETEKISMELNSLRDAENSQRRFIASKQALLRSIPAARTGLDELERERNSQKNLYEQLVARYGQSEVAKQLEAKDKAATFRIVEPALLPTRPFSPQRVRIILMGIAGGLAASFGVIVLLDQLDKSVRNIESLRSLGIQVLAVVPTIKNQMELQVSRTRDYWFYGIAAACFMMILLTVPLEILRSFSIDVFNPAEMKTYLKTLALR